MSKDLFKEFPPITDEVWESQILQELKGADYEKKLIWNTPEGFRIKPYYRAEDLKGLEYLKSNPGSYPYVRGSRIKDNNWDIREDIGTSNVVEANEMARESLLRGANSIGFNVSAIENSSQLSDLLLDIDLSKTSIHFFSAKSYIEFAELFLKEINERGVDKQKLKGSFDFDPIGYYAIYGNFYKDQEENFQEAKVIFELLSDELPNFKLITVNGQHFHNAGAYLVQVLPYTLAVANEYLAKLTEMGFDVDKIARRIQFVFAVSANYFLEIAKLRAARLLWSKIVEQYKPAEEASMKMYIHAASSIWNKTVYDPFVNMLRNTTEAMSAAIGGADSITLLPFDSVYKEANEFSKRNARNTQLLLKEESYLHKIIDPSGGSFYIETLTDGIAEKAWEQFRLIESKGGFISFYKSGVLKDEVENASQQREIEIALRKVNILGTNQYPNAEDQMLEKISRNISEEDKKNGLRFYRGSESFEKLRLATEKQHKKTGKKPKVFLLPMGNLAMRKARAAFAVNFFACAGYQIVDNKLFEKTGDGINAALDSDAEIIVICSSDEEYEFIVPPICEGIKKANKKIRIIVAGYPKELIEMLNKSGVDDFIHLKTNVLDFLIKYQKILGVTEKRI